MRMASCWGSAWQRVMKAMPAAMSRYSRGTATGLAPTAGYYPRARRMSPL
uniref:Uncharacterized protein n=1 Tax=Arundo donax TaxID=35708 RepID=A0A0A8Z6K1_ARUDO